MTGWRKRAIMAVAVLCLGNRGSGDSAAPVSTNPVDQVVAALQRGLRAPADRQAAVMVLLATGARAEPGTPDLAIDWANPGTAPYRNRALGPAYRLIDLDAGAEIHFDQTFLAGQRAQAALVQTGENALWKPGMGRFALAIQDETGQPQCATTALACTWMPLWTARYRIAVRNQSGQRLRTFLVLQ